MLNFDLNIFHRIFFRMMLPLILLSLCGCTGYLQRDKIFLPSDDDTYDEKIKVVTVPLPVIASSPNEGVTFGALAAFLIHNKKDEISTLLAPQINSNSNFGVTATLYGAFYPNPQRNIELNLSKSTKINEDYEIKIRDNSLMKEKLELNAFVFRFADGSSRFFGFEAKSPEQRETNYANTETGFNLSAGYKIGKNFQLIVGERLRDVQISHGAIKKLPYIGSRFTDEDVPGINGFTTHAQRLALVYSTLDSRDTPTYGGYARVSVEASNKFLGSSEDFRHYEVEMKGYIPSKNNSFISVFRLMYNQTLGKNVPFLERSILGGETTLRGYGRNRFIDSSFLLCNLEERIRLFRWEVFNVTADWEIAPFVDLGAVMESLDKATREGFEFNPGIGFRAIVRPNIVGRVDLGVGRSGPAIFVGLGYPF